MNSGIEELRNTLISDLDKIAGEEDLEQTRIKYLGRKGLLAGLFEQLKNIPPNEKKEFGKDINDLKNFATEKIEEKQKIIKATSKNAGIFIDTSIPGRKKFVGSTHALTQTLDDIKKIFYRMGFDVALGPEIETDYYNFGALNFQPDHPARDMQDTFFLGKDILLRTHTSPVQIRTMENNKPPIRVIIPGRVYRNEAISARSYCLFHQVEGLYIDDHVTFGELKGTLVSFARQFYGSSLKYKFRPSFFPFTEPSAEMDITCYLCGGKGCRVCKFSGWLEILGCGMVDPNVLKNVNIDPEKYTGYAFGMGIDRIALLKYDIDDIRIFFDNDVRFLRQF